MSTVCLTKLGIVIETTWLFGLCIVLCVCQPQNPPASTVLAPDIKSSPDDNSLGGGVRSPAILRGERWTLTMHIEELGKLALDRNRIEQKREQKSLWPKIVKLYQKAILWKKI